MQVLNDMQKIVVAIGSISVGIIITIILLLKLQTNDTVVALDSTAINNTVTNATSAVQEPVSWFGLIVIFVVLSAIAGFFFNKKKGGQY